MYTRAIGLLKFSALKFLSIIVNIFYYGITRFNRE
jgi:hypothetical protein